LAFVFSRTEKVHLEVESTFIKGTFTPYALGGQDLTLPFRPCCPEILRGPPRNGKEYTSLYLRT